MKYIVKLEFSGRGKHFNVGDELTGEMVKDWKNLDKMVSSGYLEKMLQDADANDAGMAGDDLIGRAIKKRNKVGGRKRKIPKDEPSLSQ